MSVGLVLPVAESRQVVARPDVALWVYHDSACADPRRPLFDPRTA